MSLARFGVTKPVPVNLLVVTFLLAGLFAANSLTREFFPDTNPKACSVTIVYPGATPEEVEESMARKIEDKLADLDEVDRITATIAEGGGGIFVEFKDSVSDVTKAVDEVERAIDTLTDLPEEAERIEVAEFEPTLPVIMVTLFGDADEEAQKRAIRDIRDDLRTLPGMGDVQISGVRDYEVRVDVDPAALVEHRLSLPQLADRVGAWLADVPGGTVRSDIGNFNVRTLGVSERSESIRQIPIRAMPDGRTLLLRDIATVREDFVDEDVISRFATSDSNGSSVSLTVYRVGDQDAVEIAEMVREYVRGRTGEAYQPRMVDRVLSLANAFMKAGAEQRGAAFKPMLSKRKQGYDLGADSSKPLPGDLEIHSDLARFIEGRLDLLTRNAKWGGMLVFMTLLIFLNWRVALWVGAGLVIAICGTLMIMLLAGITLNLLTMFGLIVVMGLLVDDAIVVAENIQARHDRNEPSLVAAVRGTNQVFWPVVATVLTSIVAFLPLTFLKGMIGDLLGALPYVVACALTMSLVESVLILPSHMGHSLVHRDKAKTGKLANVMRRFEQARDNVLHKKVIPAYERCLRLSLSYRYVSVSIAIATLVASAGLVAGGFVGFTFLDDSDSETIIIDVRMPVGTSIEQTEFVVDLVEAAARQQSKELKSISTYVGMRANVDDTQGVLTAGKASHLGQLFVELKPVELRERESSKVIDSIRETANVDDFVESLSFSEIQGGPGGTALSIEIKGPDIDRSQVMADQIKSLLKEYDGVIDIADDNYAGQREMQIRLKPGAAALGLSVGDVARQVRGALYGIDAHVFSQRQEDIDVRVRLGESLRNRIHAVENMWIIGPTGDQIPLQEVADVQEGVSYSTIKRIDRERTITVTADTVSGVNPEEISGSLSPKLEALRVQYPDIDIEFSGRQREMAKAFGSLPIGFLAAFIMIYVILAWLFSSYVQPIAVMLAIPFGTIGVIWGHYLLGFEITFLSLIGVVALSGIVVNDSLILMEFYNDRRREGVTVYEALIEAGKQRLRPIFLTTVTTVLGLTPLMLEQSFQARFLIPMAISISAGLLSATVLILMVLPCIIVIINDVKNALYFLWHGRRRPDAMIRDEASLLDQLRE